MLDSVRYRLASRLVDFVVAEAVNQPCVRSKGILESPQSISVKPAELFCGQWRSRRNHTIVDIFIPEVQPIQLRRCRFRKDSGELQRPNSAQETHAAQLEDDTAFWLGCIAQNGDDAAPHFDGSRPQGHYREHRPHGISEVLPTIDQLVIVMDLSTSLS